MFIIYRVSRSWIIAVLGIVLFASACAPAADLPTLAVIPSPVRTAVPTAIVPTATPLTLTPPPVTATEIRPSITPTLIPTETPVLVFIESITHDDNRVSTNVHQLCEPSMKQIRVTTRSEIGIDVVSISWTTEMETNTRPVAMVQGEPNVWGGEIGPFDLPGMITYQITVRDANGGVIESEPQTFEVFQCDIERPTITSTPGPTPTNTPYIGEAQSVHATDQTVIVQFETPITILLAWEGGIGPYQVSAGQPRWGRVSGIGANLVYTPNSGFSGSDNFEFVVTDSSGQASRGTITIEVLSPPF